MLMQHRIAIWSMLYLSHGPTVSRRYAHLWLPSIEPFKQHACLYTSHTSVYAEVLDGMQPSCASSKHFPCQTGMWAQMPDHRRWRGTLCRSSPTHTLHTGWLLM